MDPTLSGGIGLSGRQRPGAQVWANTTAGTRNNTRIKVIVANLFNIMGYTLESRAKSDVHKELAEQILPLRDQICQCNPADKGV